MDNKFKIGDTVRSKDLPCEYGEITRIYQLDKPVGGDLISVSISSYTTLMRPKSCWELIDD